MRFREWPLEMSFDGDQFTLNKKCVDEYTKERSKICFKVMVYFENWRSITVKIYSLYLERFYDSEGKNSTSSKANVLV